MMKFLLIIALTTVALSAQAKKNVKAQEPKVELTAEELAEEKAAAKVPDTTGPSPHFYARVFSRRRTFTRTMC